ncbi:hypothetical protein ACWCOP_12530 [Maricaulaceae bacterium MS644]
MPVRPDLTTVSFSAVMTAAFTGLAAALALAFGLSVAGAAPGFAQQSAPPPDEPPQRLQIDPRRFQPVDRSQFQIQDFSQLRPVQPETRERDPRLAVIDWTAAFSDRERQIAALRESPNQSPNQDSTNAAPNQGFLPQISRGSRERIQPVHMPVLLPAAAVAEAITTRAGGEPGMMLLTRAYFYDAAWNIDGMSVQVNGTRLINHRGNAVARAADLNRGRDGDGYRVVTNESGLTADFSRYGGAYTVTIECGSGTDPRCADETYLRGLLDRLIVAGGNPDEEG